jgi:hypothetical protein
MEFFIVPPFIKGGLGGIWDRKKLLPITIYYLDYRNQALGKDKGPFEKLTPGWDALASPDDWPRSLSSCQSRYQCLRSKFDGSPITAGRLQ